MAISDAFRNIRNRLVPRLITVAEEMTNTLSDKMIEKAPTGDIKSAIKSEGVIVEGSRIVGKVSVDLGIAPEARAYEYGSGLHSEKAEKYPIPKDESTRKENFLVFPWEKAYAYIRRTKDGKVILKRVMHPGVEAKPYIEPSVDELRKGVKGFLGRAILDEFRVAFKEAED